MSNKIAITLLEQGNSEAPNIGTITGVTNGELLHKAMVAIGSHFDGQVTQFVIKDKLRMMDIVNSAPIDARVEINNEEHFNIELQQTWIY